jgi:hypothetical protein
MNIRALSSLAGLAAATALGTPAVADDGKNYPGALCQPTAPTSKFHRDSAGRIVNPGPLGESYICPAVRDTEWSVQSANVVLADLHPLEDIVCTFHSRTRTGATVETSTKETDGTGTTILAMDPWIDTVDHGYFYFRCDVPPPYLGRQSGIISYEVVEN